MVIRIPGFDQRDDITKQEDSSVNSLLLAPSQLVDHATRAEIAELAYLIWQERGCQKASAESDWLEAEHRVQQRVSSGADLL